MHLHSNTDECTAVMEALILSCAESVERLAWRYARSVDEHADYVSIGMLRVCEVAARALSRSQPRGYACAAARNAMIDEYRRLRQVSLVSLDAPLAAQPDSCLAEVLPDPASSPEVLLLAQARQQALYEALARLTARQRLVVWSRFGLAGAMEAVRASGKRPDSSAGTRALRKLARDAQLREDLDIDEGVR